MSFILLIHLNEVKNEKLINEYETTMCNSGRHIMLFLLYV